MPKGVFERTKEHCQNISRAHTGVPLSEEHCRAVSEAKTGVKRMPFSDEHRKNLAKAHVCDERYIR